MSSILVQIGLACRNEQGRCPHTVSTVSQVREGRDTDRGSTIEVGKVGVIGGDGGVLLPVVASNSVVI